jgi:hypothetical protein
VIERAEKQIILARHARRLLHFIDDNPVVPGDTPKPYEYTDHAREVLGDAESDLRTWKPIDEPIPTAASETTPNVVSKRDTTAGHPGTATASEGEPVPDVGSPSSAANQSQVQADDTNPTVDGVKESPTAA